MNEEESYRKHLQINALIILAIIVLSAVIIFVPWHIGIIYPLVVGSSLLSLCYSYYTIQYHEIRTIIRVFIALDCILLAVATPVAFA